MQDASPVMISIGGWLIGCAILPTPLCALLFGTGCSLIAWGIDFYIDR